MSHEGRAAVTDDNGLEPESSSQSISSVYQQAKEAPNRYGRTEEVELSCEDLQEDFSFADITHARLQYDIQARHLSLTRVRVNGYLWDDTQAGYRYSLCYARSESPDSLEPFTSYEYQLRYQHGTVNIGGEGRGDITFEPQGRPGNKEKQIGWNSIPSVDQVRLIEGELARNPEFARHRLSELEAWEEVADILKYNTGVFKD